MDLILPIRVMHGLIPTPILVMHDLIPTEACQEEEAEHAS